MKGFFLCLHCGKMVKEIRGFVFNNNPAVVEHMCKSCAVDEGVNWEDGE